MHRLDASQTTDAAALLARAFYDDPGFMYVFPDPEARRRQLGWLLDRIVQMDMPLGASYALSTAEAGVEAAPRAAKEAPAVVSLWVPPGKDLSVLQMARAGLIEAPLRLGVRETVRVLESVVYMERAKARFLRGRPYWYLDYFAVDPAYQGKGLGRRALRYGIEGFAGDGHPCFLFTAKAKNVAFYRGSGFEVADEAMVGGARGYRIWTMIREGGVSRASPPGSRS